MIRSPPVLCRVPSSSNHILSHLLPFTREFRSFSLKSWFLSGKIEPQISYFSLENQICYKKVWKKHKNLPRGVSFGGRNAREMCCYYTRHAAMERREGKETKKKINIISFVLFSFPVFIFLTWFLSDFYFYHSLIDFLENNYIEIAERFSRDWFTFSAICSRFSGRFIGKITLFCEIMWFSLDFFYIFIENSAFSTWKLRKPGFFCWNMHFWAQNQKFW